MAVAVSFGLIARRADQAPLRRSEPRIVEAVRRRRVRLVERSRFRDRADGNLAQLVGGVKPKSDAVDLGHLFAGAALRRAPRRRKGGAAVQLLQSLSCAAQFLGRGAPGQGVFYRFLRDFCAVLLLQMGQRAASLLQCGIASVLHAASSKNKQSLDE